MAEDGSTSPEYLRGRLEAAEENFNRMYDDVKGVHEKIDGVKTDFHSSIKSAVSEILSEVRTEFKNLATKNEVEDVKKRLSVVEKSQKKDDDWRLIFTTKTGLIKTMLLAFGAVIVNILYQFSARIISLIIH